MKVPLTKKSYTNITQEHLNLKENNITNHVSNIETADGSQMNTLKKETQRSVDNNARDERTSSKQGTISNKEPARAKTIKTKVLQNKNVSNDVINERVQINDNTVVDIQKAVACTTDIDKGKTRPNKEINTMIETLRSEATVILNEKQSNKVSNSKTVDEVREVNKNIQINKQKDIDTNIKVKIEPNINTEEETDNIINIRTIIKTERIDSEENTESSSQICCKVIKEENIVDIKQEVTEMSEKMITEENNIEIDLNKPKIEVEDTNSIVENSSTVENEDTKYSDLEKHLDANLEDVLQRKFQETFSKIQHTNKETNYELLNCKEMDDRSNINEKDISNTAIGNAEKKVEEAFHKSMSSFKDIIVSTLNEDSEYGTIKSLICEHTNKLYKLKQRTEK